MATEIPDGWTSWKAPRNWVRARVQFSSGCCVVAEAKRNPFASASDLQAATHFPGQKRTVIPILKEAGLRALHAAVKDVLTDEHKLYRFAFADSSVDRQWDSHIL
jgi:hypothetical protein